MMYMRYIQFKLYEYWALIMNEFLFPEYLYSFMGLLARPASCRGYLDPACSRVNGMNPSIEKIKEIDFAGLN